MKAGINGVSAEGRLTTHYGESSIVDFGCWIPDKVIYSETLQRRIDAIPDLRGFNITDKAGVIERRRSPDVVTVLDMAELAARDAIPRSRERHDFSIQDIDTILYCAVSRMYSEPSTACLLQQRLGITSAMSLDLSDACLGFLNGLIIADSLIKAGRSKLILVVSAEMGSRVLESSYDAILSGSSGAECLPALTLGDGAVAVIMSSKDLECRPLLRLKAFSRATLGEYSDCCILPSTESPMVTDSKRIFEGALRHYPGMFRDLMQDLGWGINDLSMIVPHQASLKIIRQGMSLIDFPMEKCAVSIDYHGNMASVSIPYTLLRSIQDRNLSKGDKIILLGFGSGLSFSMMALEVDERRPGGGGFPL